MTAGYYRFLMRRSWEVALTCDTSGPVRDVTFYINGATQFTDATAPYKISGDWVSKGQVKYATWGFDFDRKYLIISCRARGFDGTEAWKTIEMSTIV